ncbi:helix-turn-helix transcriptional regulator [Yokenella regensburgei]|uniref:helix-turn-helix domain-containing protein n=1 Tax=Yokenella regensburgei TaxID=158877 RepID=UPI0031D14A5E
MKSTFIISDDIYLRAGVSALVQDAGFTAQYVSVDTPGFMDAVSEDDVVIFYLNHTTAACFEAAAALHKRCRLMLLLDTLKLKYLCEASLLVSARAPYPEMFSALMCLTSRQPIKHPQRIALSAKETFILRETMNGRKVNAIASALNLSPKTVYTHRANLFNKLGGSSVNALFSLKNMIPQEALI